MYQQSSARRPRLQRVDVSGMDRGDAVKLLKSLPDYADVELFEVPDQVTLSGVSLRQAAELYAAFEHDCFGSQVVEFSRNGKTQLWKGGVHDVPRL